LTVFERFTSRARDVVVTAQAEARDLRAGRIGTEHLLLGLLATGGTAAGVLGDLGVRATDVRARVARLSCGGAPADPDPEALAAIGIDLEAIRRHVEASFGAGALDAPAGRGRRRRGHVPFSPRAKKVLELSLREALTLGDRHIGTEHVLLGLVREGAGLGAATLVAAGVDLHAVRAAVLAARRRTA
jgi:ATP-dependent Clp protease ATP-binding subunit ClpA